MLRLACYDDLTGWSAGKFLLEREKVVKDNAWKLDE
jgi:hypothetical protein